MRLSDLLEDRDDDKRLRTQLSRMESAIHMLHEPVPTPPDDIDDIEQRIEEIVGELKSLKQYVYQKHPHLKPRRIFTDDPS